MKLLPVFFVDSNCIQGPRLKKKRGKKCENVLHRELEHCISFSSEFLKSVDYKLIQDLQLCLGNDEF